MADSRQFGSLKNTGSQPGDSEQCSQCEAMLMDALDGTLSPADQAVFDSHMAHCGPCSQMLADARRGAAWLEMLRDPRPEPPADLLERILTQTSGLNVAGSTAAAGVPAFASETWDASHTFSPAASAAPVYAKVLPFRTRFVAAVRTSAFGQVMLQPRLAMTAAMAFFSIALTLDLTGVRLSDLHASDLRPASIKRGFYSTSARVGQYYDSLRVVYELESRVHDLQSTSDSDSSTTTPATQPATTQPDQETPATQPAPANQKPSAQPGRGQRPRNTSPAPNSGTSRRDLPGESRRLVAANRDADAAGLASVFQLSSSTSNYSIHEASQGGQA